MKKEDLLKTASQLKQPSAEATAEFSQKANIMTQALNDRFARRSDLAQLSGEGNTEMMHDNHRNHMRFMISVFTNYEPLVLVETVLWVYRAYRSHGFKLTYWPAQLDGWVEVFKQELSESGFVQVYPFYNWMIVNNAAFVALSDELIMNDSKFNPAKLH